MDAKERDAINQDRRTEKMNSDYLPNYRPEAMPTAENRMANATDYAAFQLGQINRKLDKLIAAAELLAAKL